MSIGLVAYLVPQHACCLLLAGDVASRPNVLQAFQKLPARFARLARVAAVVVATAAAPTTATKALSTTPWPIGLWFGLVDGQGSSAQIGSIQGCDRLVGLTGVRHFHKAETARTTRLPVGHKSDFLHGAVRLENVAQFGFCCAVGQITNVQVLHCSSFLNKSSRVADLLVLLEG